MTNLPTLADRIEAGTVEMQRELLEAAFLAVFVQPKGRAECDIWDDRGDRFQNMLDAGAYVDAAMMLVPDGWEWMAGHGRSGAIGYVHNGELAFLGIGTRPNPARRWYECRAETTALALAACCLRAHASEATNV